LIGPFLPAPETGLASSGYELFRLLKSLLTDDGCIPRNLAFDKVDSLESIFSFKCFGTLSVIVSKFLLSLVVVD